MSYDPQLCLRDHAALKDQLVKEMQRIGRDNGWTYRRYIQSAMVGYEWSKPAINKTGRISHELSGWHGSDTVQGGKWRGGPCLFSLYTHPFERFDIINVSGDVEYRGHVAFFTSKQVLDKYLTNLVEARKRLTIALEDGDGRARTERPGGV